MQIRVMPRNEVQGCHCPRAVSYLVLQAYRVFLENYYTFVSFTTTKLEYGRCVLQNVHGDPPEAAPNTYLPTYLLTYQISESL